MKLKIKVVPGASRCSIDGWLGDELKIRVTAAPEKGKANKAVIEFIESALNLPRGSVTLYSGATNPHKILQFDDSISEIVTKRLHALT
jgi:uncharacterized protein (TIGR00251 family)